MDTIRISFKDLEPQEVRVNQDAGIVVLQQGDWCLLGGRWLSDTLLWFVKFKAKLERWERVRGLDSG